MRRDIQLLVPLVLFGLSLLAVLMGLILLTSLKWEAVLEDVGLVETTEITFSIPLPTSSPTQAAARDPVVAKVVEPSPTEVPIVRKTHAPNTRTGVDDIDRIIDVMMNQFPTRLNGNIVPKCTIASVPKETMALRCEERAVRTCERMRTNWISPWHAQFHI